MPEARRFQRAAEAAAQAIANALGDEVEYTFALFITPIGDGTAVMTSPFDTEHVVAYLREVADELESDIAAGRMRKRTIPAKG